MNTNDENLKKSQLLQLAQQGNEKALAQLLNQALAHKQIKTVVKLTEDQLKISLVAQQIPEPWSSKVLIDRELLKLHWSNTPTIQVQGYQSGVEDPAWTEEFLLGTQAQATKTHSLEKQIIPVEESQKKRKKYQFKLPTKPIEKAGWQALAIGLLLAIILQSFWPLNILFYGFNVIVHEIGHAVTHWLFGYPAIPTVNILYGGGITLSLEQSPLVLGLIYGTLAFLLYRFRHSRRLLILLTALIGIYTLVLLTPLSKILMIFMGHGMEWIAIVICLYFAIGGYFCQLDLERPLYAMLGFFLLFSDLKNFWGLIFDPDLRDFYEQGVGGVLDNDFVILARDYLNVDLSIVAGFFLVGCIFTPLVAFLLFRYEKVWLGGISSFLSSE
jgi:hypothetical protein